MWRGGSTQQRVWLGPGQYRGRRRDAASNPNSHADSCVISNAVRGWNTNTYANSNGYTSSSDSNAYSDSDGDGDGDTYSDSCDDSYPNSAAHSDTQGYSYTQGSPNSASSAVSA